MLQMATAKAITILKREDSEEDTSESTQPPALQDKTSCDTFEVIEVSNEVIEVTEAATLNEVEPAELITSGKAHELWKMQNISIAQIILREIGEIKIDKC